MAVWSEHVMHSLNTAMLGDGVVGVHFNEASLEVFTVGFVLSVSDRCFCVGCLDPNGKADGCTIGFVNEIHRITSKTEYLDGIGLLFGDQGPGQGLQHWDLLRQEAVPDLSFTVALRRLSQENLIVTLIDYEGGSVSGLVTEVGDDFANLNVITENGNPDGSVSLDLSRIRKLEFGRTGEQAMERLRRLRVLSDST